MVQYWDKVITPPALLTTLPALSCPCLSLHRPSSILIRPRPDRRPQFGGAGVLASRPSGPLVTCHIENEAKTQKNRCLFPPPDGYSIFENALTSRRSQRPQPLEFWIER